LPYGGHVNNPATPKKTGYYLQGWYVSKDGTNKWVFGNNGTPLTENHGVVLDDGGETGTLVLYAVWAGNTYKVTFNSNGGVGSSPDATQCTVSKGTNCSVSLKANKYTKAGWAYVNWNTSASGNGISYADKQANIVLTGNLTLYATWKFIPPTVSSVSLHEVNLTTLSVSWKVSNAQKQEVKLVNKLGAVIYTNYVAGGDTSSSFYEVSVGSYHVEVVAIKDSTKVSATSNAVTLTLPKKIEVVSEVPFNDTQDVVAPARGEAITWLLQYGITTGCNPPANDQFCPTAPVNRGAMAQFMHRLVGGSGSAHEVDISFMDIGDLPGDRQADILWLASKGISTGSPSGAVTYKPHDVVTRGAMAEFLYKLAGSPGAINPSQTNKTQHHVKASEVKAEEARFAADQDLMALKKTNPNRYYDILWLAKTGITVGSTDEHGVLRYKPNDPVNRGAMAEFMQRMYKFVS
jgi:hypothetical protein